MGVVCLCYVHAGFLVKGGREGGRREGGGGGGHHSSFSHSLLRRGTSSVGEVSE